MLQQIGTADISIATKKVEARERAGLTSATPERMAKAGLENVEVGEGTLVQRIVDAPLDRMRKAKVITDREFGAGERYRNDEWMSKINPAAPSVDWGAMGGNFGPRNPSMFSSQSIADARMRWRDLERRIPKQSLVGTILHLTLVREMALEQVAANIFNRSDKRECVVVGKAVFRVALAALADAYAM